MSSVITKSDVRIEYETFGRSANSPLLLIQGLGAQMIGWPDKFCEQLAETGFYVIRFDNRDVGLSQKFDGIKYGISNMATDSAELLEAIGINKAHIMGQSMGGMIAQHMAFLYPEKVSTLTLLYTSAQNIYISGGDILAEREKTPLATSREEAMVMYVAAEEPCGSPAYRTDVENLQKIGGLMWDRCYYPEGATRQRIAMENDPDRRKLLQKIKCPVTILHGDSDKLISAEGSIDIHLRLPHSSLHIYQGMGHQIPQPLWQDMISRIKTMATEDTRSREKELALRQ